MRRDQHVLVVERVKKNESGIAAPNTGDIGLKDFRVEGFGLSPVLRSKVNAGDAENARPRGMVLRECGSAYQ
jgi:hypothetical protein